MNCCNGHNHNNENRNHSESHKGHMKHILMMALCCGAPVIALVIIALFGTRLPGIKGILTSITPFLCPLMMLAMLPMMLKKEKPKQEGHSRCEVKQIESDK